MTFDPNEFEGQSREGVVFRDKRRIDPNTGEVREPVAAPATDPAPAGDGPESQPATSPTQPDAEAALAERTADLQRLQAEYVNYKRRVDRDRDVVRGSAVASVLTGLLPVLDDIGRARDHGELTGGFKAVADSLERSLQGFGLVAFGEAGDPFDPRIHEALMHNYSDEVAEPVAETVLQVGYRLGDRVLRPARVAVAEPEPTSEAAVTDTASSEGAPTTYDAAGSETEGVPDDGGFAAGSDSPDER